MSKLGRMHPCQLDFADKSRLLANQRVARKQGRIRREIAGIMRDSKARLQERFEQRIAKAQLEAQAEEYKRSRTFEKCDGGFCCPDRGVRCNCECHLSFWQKFTRWIVGLVTA